MYGLLPIAEGALVSVYRFHVLTLILLHVLTLHALHRILSHFSQYPGEVFPDVVQHIVKCGIMRGDVIMSLMAWAQYRCETFIVSSADAAIAVQPAGATAEAETPGILVSGPSTATDQSANADAPSNGLAIPSSRTLPDDRMEVEYTPGTSVASA